MGDNKKPKKTYNTPRHPWQKARIDEEKILLREFGLKNKREVYRFNSLIKRMINYYKQLNYSTSEQADKEREQLLNRAKRLGFLTADKEMSAILNLTIRDALERRLQTIVCKKKLARSTKQARQFIVHQHITVNGRVVDSPSYIVPVSEEDQIEFVARSKLSDNTHPERALPQQKVEAVEEEKKEATEEPELAPVEIPEVENE